MKVTHKHPVTFSLESAERYYKNTPALDSTTISIEQGERVASSRGFLGLDPLIAYQVPRSGKYRLRIHDLVYGGSSNHFYRLDVSTSPRVLFSQPSVIERGKTTRVTLFGWNLGTSDQAVTQASSPSDYLVPRRPVTNQQAGQITNTQNVGNRGPLQSPGFPVSWTQPGSPLVKPIDRRHDQRPVVTASPGQPVHY